MILSKRLAPLMGLLLAPTLEGGQSPNFVVEPYLQNAGQTEMTVLWITPRPETAILQYGLGDSLDQCVTAAPPQTVKGPVVPSDKDRPNTAAGPETQQLYKVRLTGLKPGASYRYQVKAGPGETGGIFRTFPDKQEPFTFFAYGDTRTGVKLHRKVVLAMAAAQPSPAFILHTGDLTSGGTYPLYLSQFFTPLAGVINRIPLFPQRGNHEGDGLAYQSLFAFPGTNRWYSFDYANAHFAGLDSTADKATTEAMLHWLDRDLAASKAEWKIVFYHYPSFDSGRHSTEWGRKTVVPLFRKHKVDLAIAGHSHGYQRTHPLYQPGENDATPITYLVAAGGGASLYDIVPNPRLAASAKQYHFVAITIDGCTLDGRTIDLDGRQIDAFRIAKIGNTFDPAYLKQAMPE